MERWTWRLAHVLLRLMAASSVARAAVAGEATPTPLREVESVRIGQWDEKFAYALPVLCDGSSLYLRLVPMRTEREIAAATAAGRPVSFGPRNVTRVSADGKTRVDLDPARSPKLAHAKSMVTPDMAVDAHETVHALVWATWPGPPGQPDSSRQFVVSFDRKGEYRAIVEIDAEEFTAYQLQVFDSGEFALRGRRGSASQSTIAILSADGGLKDVVRWPGRPSADEGTLDVLPEYLVRGGDGRVYLTDFEAQDDFVTIYRLLPTGESEPIQKLPRRLVGGRVLQGLRWSGHRFAALYFENTSAPDEPDGAGKGRYWITVADEGAEGVPLPLYGPAPIGLACFQHSDAGDRFTFLGEGGKLVTLAPE